MDKIQKRLDKLTKDVLSSPFDPSSEEGERFDAELALLMELSKTWKVYESLTVALPDGKIKERLDRTTTAVLALRAPEKIVSESFTKELKLLQTLQKAWSSFDGVEVTLDAESEEKEQNRRSAKMWDVEGSTLTTKFRYPSKLTVKQEEALELLDDLVHDKIALLGGSGSGKSFIEAYKIVKDVLRYKAPCLIARDKLIDLTSGMIDQIIPAILQLLAIANGESDWKQWRIDGLLFAKFTDKRTKLEFATGGYIRFAGLSIRDLSESGSDKILSPSWLHVMLEEISELDYEIVEKVITRLRYKVDRVILMHHGIEDVLNKLIMCENPPSIMHWSYKRFIEHKREDGSDMDTDEMSQHAYLQMNAQDNVENLGETYIRNLSQMTGANRERFFLGQFQDTETGDILRRMNWTDELPKPSSWDKLIIYTDPTPLTGKDHSKWADYKASVLMGLWGGESYVIDIRIVRGSTLDMLTNIKQLWDVSPNQSITEVWMENKQVPSDFKQVLATFSVMTGWMIPIQMDKRHFGDKKAAIETFLQPLVENDLIFFNKAWRDTERGKQCQFQWLKFSRKSNKNVHDDIPDAIMKADTKMKGKQKRRRVKDDGPKVHFVTPTFFGQIQ